MDSENLSMTPAPGEVPQGNTMTKDKHENPPVPIVQLSWGDGYYEDRIFLEEFSPYTDTQACAWMCVDCAFTGPVSYNFDTCGLCQTLRFTSVLNRLRRETPATKLWTTPVNDRKPPPEFVNGFRYNVFQSMFTYADQLFNTSSKWAQGQISACLNSHQQCRRPGRGVPFRPSRLINVSNKALGEDVVLEDGASIPPGAAYVALSYCWGGYDPDCMTTAESLEENMRRIPSSKMPATFRDAVRFTRSLGIKYLWIDSVCIIQHDKKDWHQQAGLMWDIYKHSYVTLAALYGSSSRSGLRSASTEDESTKVMELAMGNHRWPIYARPSHYLQETTCPFSAGEESHQSSPLLSRAWAFQERMISPRVLYFTRSEILFQCFTHSTCECTVLKYEFLPIQKPIVIHWDDGDKDEDEDTSKWIATTWRDRIVREYSGLLLTKPEDRLVALAAMAKQFQRLRPHEDYLAGLWSESLIEDLLWRCPSLPSEEKKRHGKKVLNRPYSFPTWSWASLKGAVNFPQYGRYSQRMLVAKIVEAVCSYDGHSSLGILTKSTLKLRGKLMPATLEWHDEVTCNISIPCIGYWAKKLNSMSGIHIFKDYSETIYLDHDGDGYQCVPRRQKVYLLWMLANFKLIEQETMSRYYLILRRDEKDKNTFSRAGIVEYMIDLMEYRADERAFAWNAFDQNSVMTECEIC
ncbi:HET-domain-containing protein [Daldinia bambusicola]|nr:HET-domain-containing protein [Daldinia bambusicola]